MSALDALLGIASSLIGVLSIALCTTAILAIASFAALRSSRRRMESVRRAEEAAHEMCGEGVLVVRSCGRVLEANRVAHEILWSERAAGETLRLPEPIRIMLSDDEAQNHRLKIEKRRLIDLWLSPTRQGGDGLRGILLRDVTEEERGRSHLLQLAHYDSLTGLGNRRLFIDHLENAIIRAKADGSRIALNYIDIDRFKEVNDTFGHAAGDELLKSVARRLREQMLEWESQADERRALVARLSGDEFAVVAIGVSSGDEAGQIAESILGRLGEVAQIGERSLSGSGSLGISLFPDHGGDVEDLVKAADAALYVAKQRGRGLAVVYEESFRAQADQARNIEKQLRNAIELGELQLHYQPKVELENNTTAGFEALLRWYNNELGFVSPKDFIPVAEERGLICEIGAWCIEEACRQIRIWRDAGFETVPVSVNVSSVQFTETDLQRVVTDALVRHDIEPAGFEIELTESLILDDNDETALTLRDLRAIGVHVALDDFGTGYSALTYLNRFPLDTVKMDRGFLRGIEDDKAAAGLAAAVISMSHSLGFDVVAEGVDSERQARLLTEMSCDQIQGFLYSPAVPATEAARFLATAGSGRPTMSSQIVPAEVDQILAAGDSSTFEQGLPTQKQPEGPKTEVAGGEAPETRVLVIDDDSAALGPIALRMLRLGADTHMVQNADEASLFISQEEPVIDLLVVEPDVDLGRLAMLREALGKANPDKTLRVLVIGDEPSEERRAALREGAVDWLVLGHAEDAELRFFIGAARYHGEAVHMQRSVRVPLESTVWIRSGGERQVGMLTNLSRRGAFVETDHEYEIGKSVRLEFKVGEKRICVFGLVTNRNGGEADSAPYRPVGFGVIFFESERDTEDDLSEIIEQIWNRYRP